MNDNLSVRDPDGEQRIRERAYRLWEDEGRPHGRDVEIWERARELDAIEQNREVSPSVEGAARKT